MSSTVEDSFLYLVVFPRGNDIAEKMIVRHRTGEEATQLIIDRLLSQGFFAHELLGLETILLPQEGEREMVIHLGTVLVPVPYV